MKTQLVSAVNSDNQQTIDALFSKYDFLKTLPSTFFNFKTAEEVIDIAQRLKQLNTDFPLSVKVKQGFNQENEAIISVFLYDLKMHLSKWVPLFDSMKIELISQDRYEVKLDQHAIQILEMKVNMKTFYSDEAEQLESVLREIILNTLNHTAEVDELSALIFLSGFTLKQVQMVRAYVHYMFQTQLKASQKQIISIILNYHHVIKKMTDYFEFKFNPDFSENRDQGTLDALSILIQDEINKILKLEDDQVINLFWSLINATLRTNYFCHPQNNVMSFKLMSKNILFLPKPIPLYEIFVYSPELEGIHLRSSNISRGGIRFSDRIDDYRTEILGLMKAQKVKNSIIVPSGAKGGFVIKKNLENLAMDEYKKTVKQCYELFISSLLTLTDNIVDGEIIRPRQIRCLDEPDTYFVVAADKGTAAFSDVANAISDQHGFWMRDAFASGGSTGYSHKEIGITAKGAWTSLESHLRDLNLSLTEENISVVGIGDMSGDVFGNAMLLSSKIKLIAAFDHRHIFIDPSPDPLQAYLERKRLFALPHSSWQDYQSQKISKGGGVFSRQVKSIPLTPEMKLILSTEAIELTPDECIQAILKAKVHIIFNGGIGTFIKSSLESDADVRDKLNDGCRVNGNQIRSIMVVEGGNLGVTQLGRIEYALNGGRINTDFIDNSAGVDCSDKEVNIKIFLDDNSIHQDLTAKKRNQLLVDLKSEVIDLVLNDNYEQALLLNYSSQHAAKYIDLYQDTLKNLENLNVLDRKIEFLPDDKVIETRKQSGQGLTRPEMSVLMAYVKIHLKSEILKSNLLEEDFFADSHLSYFPKSLRTQFSQALLKHRLKDNIKATVLSNYLVNRCGIAFLQRVSNETKKNYPTILKAFYLADKIYRADELYQMVFKLDNKVNTKMQYELLHYIRYALHLATRWFLRSGRLEKNMQAHYHYYQKSVDFLIDKIPSLIVGKTKEYFEMLKRKIPEAILTDQEIQRIAMCRVLHTALNIAEIAHEEKLDLQKVAELYFCIGGKFGLVVMRDAFIADNREGSLNSRARLTIRDDLDLIQRKLTILILNSQKQMIHVEAMVLKWKEKHAMWWKQWESILKQFDAYQEINYTQVFIMLREMFDLIVALEKVKAAE